jgi:Domain of unknown function (DUF4178)
MSYRNPTPIRIGMTGNLSGKQYRVVGRVVLGEEENGETYYWNEFNLEGDGGEAATLVYEESEQGGEWRLFYTFEPDYPMTAADAATKRAGDPLNLDGTQVFVRLVAKSRVYDIEGKAPEGVEVGDVAHYFNAATGNNMIVVSWTGEEVEFYKGLDLSQTTVSSAFNVRLADFSRLFPAQGGSRRLSGLVAGVVGALIVVILAVVGYRSSTSSRRPLAVVRTGAPASPLALGKTGKLGGTRFQVQSHLLVEMAMVGWKFDRHEYVLSDDEGTKALLVRGSKPGAGDWWLFQPLQPLTPLSPQQAAAVRWGQTMNLDGLAAKVSELFQSTIRQAESPEASDLNPGDVFFGFTGRTQNGQLLVRWNASYVNFFQGRALQEKDVVAAFGQPPRK